MEAVEPAVVLVHPDLLDTALAAATKAGIPQNRLFQFSDTECGPSHGVQDCGTMCASAAESEAWDLDPLTGDTASSTIAAINFSSGTTGLPKMWCICQTDQLGKGTSPTSCVSESWLEMNDFCFGPRES